MEKTLLRCNFCNRKHLFRLTEEQKQTMWYAQCGSIECKTKHAAERQQFPPPGRIFHIEQIRCGWEIVLECQDTLYHLFRAKQILARGLEISENKKRTEVIIIMDKFDPNEHLVDLKVKKYLPVAPRVAWFRQDKPCWRINTELVEFKHENNYGIAVFHCKIYDENGNVVSTGYGSETLSDFRDYFEKAETKAIGRALAALGYGTLFALELDEGEAIADAPQAPTKPQIVPCDECGVGIHAI